jgi:hypothetical protein
VLLRRVPVKVALRSREWPGFCPAIGVLEHDPEKWMPVFRKDHAPTNNLDPDPIQLDWIRV